MGTLGRIAVGATAGAVTGGARGLRTEGGKQHFSTAMGKTDNNPLDVYAAGMVGVVGGALTGAAQGYADTTGSRTEFITNTVEAAAGPIGAAAIKCAKGLVNVGGKCVEKAYNYVTGGGGQTQQQQQEDIEL
ncbi:hypothetical protein GQ42DRAFT_83504 [Ramicandelaber brevisporus]|nr:hypothetical protein GQ42DRAFT_83504 [Ramicandelaber brevisporus]